MDWEHVVDEAADRADRKNELWAEAALMAKMGLAASWYGGLSDDDKAIIQEIRELLEQSTDKALTSMTIQLKRLELAVREAAQDGDDLMETALYLDLGLDEEE